MSLCFFIGLQQQTCESHAPSNYRTQGFLSKDCLHLDIHPRVQEEAALWAQGEPSCCPDRIFCLLSQVFTYFAVVVGGEQSEVGPLQTCELLLIPKLQFACKIHTAIHAV